MLGGVKVALPFFASGAKPKVAKKGGCIPPNRREGRLYPS